MPFLNIKVAGPTLAPEQVSRLQREATGLMAGILRKKPELTVVLVEQLSPADWSIGAQPVRASAHLDAKITEGTNTPEEKSRFVAEAMALLRAVLGVNLDPVAYVVVHELPGDAWGWDGLTQADRAQAAKAA